ncbi:MAG: hypothetical protein M3167_10055 [Acidobacteriota bacterium]|nr:hypothetical protein [Acidobacteriota bacterium]
MQAALDLFVESARNAFGPELDAVVLDGSGAEGRLRSTSDLNVLVVLSAFDPVRADALARSFQAPSISGFSAPQTHSPRHLSAARRRTASRVSASRAAARAVSWPRRWAQTSSVAGIGLPSHPGHSKRLTGSRSKVGLPRH